MSRKVLAVTLVFLWLAALAGCATNGYYDPGRSAAAGALGGAATGAALGSIIGAGTGSPATGAWIGAAAGAVAGGVGGYLYAQHMNNQTQSAQAAAQAYNYTPSRGNVVEIDKVDATPGRVRPGQQVDLVMSYTFLTPDNAAVAATLSRQVQRGGVTVGQPHQVQVNNYNGTYVDQVRFGLPSNAGPGTYTVISRVSSSYGNAERSTYFIVE
jgi:outer membrane lipoprotein SlyB